MKKFTAFLLCVLLTASLFAGCGKKEAPPAASNPPQAQTTTPPVQTVPEKDYSAYAGIVADPQTWYDTLMALPIANDSMTEEELRQLCVDAFRINLTFTWTPTVDVRYSYTLLERTSEYFLPKGIAYSGLCYASGYERGTIWKVLQYYDRQTGALDIEAMGENFLYVISSACSRGCQWGWNRVCNSSDLSWMTTYERGQSNIVLVGPYTYEPNKYSFNHGDGTPNIIKENGEQIMMESYACMKPADGVYTSSGYHVMMIAQEPVIVRWPSGAINADQSYVIVLEQDAKGSSSDQYNYAQENGVAMRPLGGVDNKYTFKQLMDKGYVPFTIKELIGEDPVEPGKAWIGTETYPIENGSDLALEQILGKSLFGNYALCTLEFQVKSPDGKVLATFTPPIDTYPSNYSVPLQYTLEPETVAPYANGSNTIHIYTRLSNGELVEAFNTILKVL